MTEKRYVKGYHTVRDMKENNVYDFRIDVVCDLLNEQEEITQKYKHLVKIATNLIEWNTIPQIRRAWQNYLEIVGENDD